MAKQMTTEEILALARSEGAIGSGGSAPAEAAPTASAEPEVPADSGDESAAEDSTAEAPAAEAPAASATPTSTADILAAARAQAAGGEAAKPAAKEKPAAEESKPTPAGGGSAPTSTADILAAARAQAAGGGGAVQKASPAAKPAAKASPKAPPSAKPSGDIPSVQEMLKAAREGRTDSAAVDDDADEKAKPDKPALPNKPLPKKKAAESGTPRRGVLVSLLLSPFAMAWTLFSVASGVFGLALARFMMPNVLVEPPTKFKIGPASDYPPEAVVTKWKALRGIWVVNTTSYNGEQLIYALSTVCTHLGCTPNWLEGEQKFKCPCHGSGFYINGINFEGPAPRPLERVGIRVAEDGMLEVDKSLKFQEEMGQWEDGNSFVAV